MDKAEEWIIEQGSMSYLHTLTIIKCTKLKVPDGLRYITSLKELTVVTMTWKEELSEGGEDYCKVQHIPLVQFKASFAD